MRKKCCVFFALLLSLLLCACGSSRTSPPEPEPEPPERFSAQAAALLSEKALFELETDADALLGANGIDLRLASADDDPSDPEGRGIVLVTDGEDLRLRFGPAFTELQARELTSILNYCADGSEDFSNRAERSIRGIYHYGIALKETDFAESAQNAPQERTGPLGSVSWLWILAAALIAAGFLIGALTGRAYILARRSKRRDKIRQELREPQEPDDDWSPIV